MKTAQLYFGYFWDCDCCGEENFARRMVTGDDDLIAPVLIGCWNCKVVFKAELPEEEELEDDDQELWKL